MAEVFDFGLQQHKIKMDGKFFENNLFAVAGDTGRRLEIQLLDSDNMIQNTTGISLRLNANVAGQATYAEATLVDATKGSYELDLPNGMLIAPGNWQFQWQIIGANGEKLHSFAFTGSVGSNLAEGGTEALNFYLNAQDLKDMQEDFISGAFDSTVLETNIGEKLTDLETQYSPRITGFSVQLAQNEQEVSLLSTKVGNLGSTSTFKGSATNALIIAKTGMNVGDEWYDTTNNKSLRWNGASWVEVGSVIKLGSNSVKPENTSFFEKGKNEFDKTKAKVGYYVNQASGAIVANATHNATDYIEGYPSKKIIFSQPVQRYAFYDANKTFISGGLNVFTLTYPVNASLVVASSDSWNLETLQVEEGIVTTSYEAYQTVIPQRFLGYKPETETVTPSFVGDINKEYRMIGANIRTPLVVGGAYSLLNDAGHEPMGITSVTIVGDELRVGMNFTAKKVISMSIMPHVSLMQEGYSVATTGGLSVHAVYFYKNGAMVPAKDVVINGGSFWFSGTFLV